MELVFQAQVVNEILETRGVLPLSSKEKSWAGYSVLLNKEERPLGLLQGGNPKVWISGSNTESGG